MRSLRLLPCLAAASTALFLASARPALAVDAWSAPADVPGPRTSAPALAFDGDGLGVLAADTDGAAPAFGPHAVGGVWRDDAFTPLATLTPADFGLSGNVATYARSRAVALGTRFSGTSDRVGLAFGSAGGELTDVHPLGPTDRQSVAESVAASTSGNVAGSFGACEAPSRCGRQNLYLVTRLAGRPVQRSIRIAGDADGWISTVAVNPRGDALVAWQGADGVFARIRSARGTVSATQLLGVPGVPVTAISAVLADDGAAAVAWSAQNVSEGVPQSAATVDVAVRDPGTGHHFHTSQRLGSAPALATGHYVGERRVRLVRTSDGDITAAWTGYENGRFVVQTAGLDGFRFGAAQTVSDPTVDAVLTDLDAGPNSALAVQWRTGVAGNDPGVGPAGLDAAVRAQAATDFGAAETIEQGAAANNATLRFDPATGSAIAVWNNYGLDNLQYSARTPIAP